VEDAAEECSKGSNSCILLVIISNPAISLTLQQIGLILVEDEQALQLSRSGDFFRSDVASSRIVSRLLAGSMHIL
jgi:hypothetical protein